MRRKHSKKSATANGVAPVGWAEELDRGIAEATAGATVPLGDIIADLDADLAEMAAAAQARIPVAKGPIYGIPIEEVIAWEDSLDTDSPLPEPRSRLIDSNLPSETADRKSAFEQGLDDVRHERGRPVDDVVAASERLLTQRRETRNR